jgi:Cu+-exporting ATPase
MDSHSGLVFFLLTGKLFQAKTFETLNFERNYKSYFPLAVILKKEGKATLINDLAMSGGKIYIIKMEK